MENGTETLTSLTATRPERLPGTGQPGDAGC
jgi:hypothetical protein